jgi:hypothetical protein
MLVDTGITAFLQDTRQPAPKADQNPAILPEQLPACWVSQPRNDTEVRQPEKAFRQAGERKNSVSKEALKNHFSRM